METPPLPPFSYCLKLSSNTALALALSSDCFSIALSEREVVTESPLTGLGDTKLLDLSIEIVLDMERTESNDTLFLPVVKF